MICPSCQHANPPGSRFCEECGSPQQAACPACSHEVRASAKFCSECGYQLKATAPAGSAGEAGEESSSADTGFAAERRQLTVMFCDLVGSTVLSRQLDPEDLRDVVQAYQTAAAEEIRRFGGYIAQYLGDGLLVYFGYPTAYEDAAHRAVHGGLAILDAMLRLSRRLRASKDIELQVRIGIHTGLVVIGDVGAGGRHERLAMGDTPNLAARIQGLAPPGGVLISGATLQLIEGRMRTLDLGPQRLKGFVEPVSLHRVLGDAAQEELETRMSSQASTLVGRGDERRLLMAHWRQAQEGEAQAVFLHGDAGIGKSRMVQAVRKAIDSTSRRLELRCSPLFRHTALFPFIGLIGRSADITADDDAETKWLKLERLAQRHGFSDDDCLRVLAPLLDLDLPGDAAALPAEERRQRTRDLLARFVLSSPGQSLVVFEDLDWIDPSSREVLDVILAALDDQPILLILTSRAPEPPWTGDGGPSRHVLPLGPLEIPSVEELIYQVAGRPLPRGLVRLLSSRADGVPIFVEELTRMVIDTGLVKQGEEPVDGGRSIRQMAIPTSLQDSLLARLDRLGTAKTVVMIASTLGREFDYQLLREVSGFEDVELAQDLDRLADAGILFAEGKPPQARYLFRTALLRDAAYGSLLRSRRLELHRMIGETLERLHPEAGHQPAVLDLLAYHWTRSTGEISGDPATIQKAVSYAMQAGEQHMRRAAYMEAGSHLEEALDVVKLMPEGRERDERELPALIHLGNVYRTTIGWVSQEVLHTAQRARTLCERLGNRPELSPVLYGLWQFHLVRGEFETALNLAGDCLDLAQERDDQDLLIEAHVALSNTHFWLGELPQARDTAAEVFEIFDPDIHTQHLMSYGQDPRILAYMFHIWSLQLLGNVDQARRQHEALVELTEQINHPFMSATRLNVSGSFFLDLRDYEGTRRAGEQMLALAREVGFPHWELAGELYAAWGRAHQGEAEQVLDTARQSYSRWQDVIGGMGRTFAARIFAEICVLTGHHAEGLEVLDVALTVAEEDSERVYEAELYRLRGLHHAGLGPGGLNPLAEADLLRSHDLAQERSQPLSALRAACDLQRLTSDADSACEDACERLAQIYAVFTEGYDTPDLSAARARLSTRQPGGITAPQAQQRR